MSNSLVGMMGQKRSGKDTAASILTSEFGYTRLAFADPMKKAAYDLDPIVGHVALPDSLVGEKRLSEVVDALGWEKAKECPEVRRTLQRLGTEVGRNNFGEDFWVNLTMRLADEQRAKTPVVITDVRFPNEASAIRDAGGVLLRVDRPGLPDEDGHVSEHAWRSIEPDLIVVNDSSLEALYEEVRSIAFNL